jgi:hypothetical protein
MSVIPEHWAIASFGGKIAFPADRMGRFDMFFCDPNNISPPQVHASPKRKVNGKWMCHEPFFSADRYACLRFDDALNARLGVRLADVRLPESFFSNGNLLPGGYRQGYYGKGKTIEDFPGGPRTIVARGEHELRLLRLREVMKRAAVK